MQGGLARTAAGTGAYDRRVNHGSARRWLGLGLVAAVVVAGAPTAAAQPIDIGTPATSVVWLCRPGLADDPCRSDLTTTVLHSDGTTSEQQGAPARRVPIDCFYVYPTVSGQTTTNADLSLDPEIRAVAETQASRFSEVCRVFAPVYRQITVAGLNRPAERVAAGAIAYADVADAWRDYLEHDNDGRGVVLVGHSQGAALLSALIRNEIEGDAAVRGRVVSALLPGTNVVVPIGEDVGGTFERMSACRSRRQTGCVVSYVSFDMTPPLSARFGRVSAAAAEPEGAAPSTLEVLCVNPAAPAGGAGRLDPYFRTTTLPGPVGATSPSAFDATTPWVSAPRLYDAHCEHADGASWLQVDEVGAAADPRPRVEARLGPTWGLHLVDVNVALGNLVDLVRDQAAAYRRAHR